MKATMISVAGALMLALSTAENNIPGAGINYEPGPSTPMATARVPAAHLSAPGPPPGSPNYAGSGPVPGPALPPPPPPPRTGPGYGPGPIVPPGTEYYGLGPETPGMPALLPGPDGPIPVIIGPDGRATPVDIMPPEGPPPGPALPHMATAVAHPVPTGTRGLGNMPKLPPTAAHPTSPNVPMMSTGIPVPHPQPMVPVPLYPLPNNETYPTLPPSLGAGSTLGVSSTSALWTMCGVLVAVVMHLR